MTIIILHVHIWKTIEKRELPETQQIKNISDTSIYMLIKNIGAFKKTLFSTFRIYQNYPH